MNDSERLIEIMKHLGLSPLGEQSRFARSINYSQDAINKVVRGRDKAEISKKMASAIVNKYPIFNKAWILTDIGKMLIKEDDSNSNERIFKIEVEHNQLKRILEDRNDIIEQQKRLIEYLNKELEQVRKLANAKEDIIIERVMENIISKKFEEKILKIIRNNE